VDKSADNAARHLRLVTIGFLQYLSPTISFFLGTSAFGQAFTIQHLITFFLIWVALALVSAEALMRWRSVKAVAEDQMVDVSVIEAGR